MNNGKMKNGVWVIVSCRQNSKQLMGFSLRFPKLAFCLRSVGKILSLESTKKME